MVGHMDIRENSFISVDYHYIDLHVRSHISQLYYFIQKKSSITRYGRLVYYIGVAKGFHWL